MKFTNSLRTSLVTTVGALLLTLSSFAQAPEKMSYQAVIRGANNALVTNQQVGMQISILQGSTAVYEETQTPTSNTNGLVSLEIGTGTVISGSFTAIDWSADTYFIKTETDPTGGTNYTITGTSQLLSVPFALYAKTSGDGITTDQSDAIVLNTAKVGVTSAQANEIVANTTKVGITAVQASAITDNTAKTGIITDQSDAIVLNTAKVGITSAQSSAITDNTAKVGYTEAAVSANTDVAANTAKTGITSAQANEIVANTAKTGITTVQSDAIVANTAKVFITSAQANEIVANTAKTGITAVQSDAIVANTAKVVITSAQANEIVANTAKVGITTVQAIAITANIAKVGYTEAAVSANTDVAANTAKYSKNEVDTLIANLQSQINNLASVGDFYQGGVVFYIFESGDTGYIAGETHGLIAAVADQSSGIRWYNGSNTTTGASATTIGTGSANTDAIIAAQGATETSYAAGLARAYSGGGYTDWFLPSKDELNKMYLNRATINTTAASNGGSNFANADYWSSTEYDYNLAWEQYFFNGYQNYYNKYYTDIVRAVRAF